MQLSSVGLVWPVAVCAAAAVAAAPFPRGRVELELAAVLPLESEAASVLVLREKRGRALLPIFVGRAEARDFEARLGGRATPMEDGAAVEAGGLPDAGLLLRAVTALGARVSRVELGVARQALFRAHVALLQGARELDVEARPSEGVALAMRAGAPVYATRELMELAALTPEDLHRMRAQERAAAEAEERRPEVRF